MTTGGEALSVRRRLTPGANDGVCFEVVSAPGRGEYLVLRHKVMFGKRYTICTLGKHVVDRLRARFVAQECRAGGNQAKGTRALSSAAGVSTFAEEVVSLLERKAEDGLCAGTAFIVTPCLYSLWYLCHGVTRELFADALNESGALHDFCSLDPADAAFGSAGTWEDVEETTTSGAANPPFHSDVLHDVVTSFDDRVEKSVAYFRAAILPCSHGIQGKVYHLGSPAEVLVRIPPGNLGFKEQRHLLSGKHVSHIPNPHWNLELLLVVWVNRAYLESHRPPRDVQHAYCTWINQACLKPRSVVMHWDAFERAFPADLRCEERVSHLVDY